MINIDTRKASEIENTILGFREWKKMGVIFVIRGGGQIDNPMYIFLR